MKNFLLTYLCFILISCSESPESTPLKKSGQKEEAQRTNPYEPVGKPLTKPRVEVMAVTKSEVSLNWFDPSNWQSDPGYPSQPVFLVEASTNPKFDNLVIEREISDSHQTTFSNLQTDTPHHFRVTALPTPGDPRFLQGEPTIITVLTASFPRDQVGGFVVSPEHGKVHFSWSELQQPGPIDYVVHLLDDPNKQKPFQEFITRGTEIRDITLQGGRTYWAQFRASPAEDNDAFSTTDEITIEFDVPGNPLPQPQNISAIDRNGTLEIQWSAVTANIGEFSYMINVKTGQTLEEPFGDFVQKEAILSIPDAKPYGRFSFSIKCFPEAGNYVDLESPVSIHSFDFPVVHCPTPSSKPISRPQVETSSLRISFEDLPEAPSGHRYEIEVASDPEFSVGLDRRTIEGVELETMMTGRVPEENHYVRMRMIGPEDDATIIASSWTDTVVIEAQPKPSPPPNPLP